MTEKERNDLIFDAAVENAGKRRKAADDALVYLYSVADDIAAGNGGYAGKYLDVYMALVDLRGKVTGT